MAKLTNDLKDLRGKNIKDLEGLVLEVRENQFKNRMNLTMEENKKIILLKCTFMKELHIFSCLNYLVSHFSVDLPRLHHALVLDFLD